MSADDGAGADGAAPAIPGPPAEDLVVVGRIGPARGVHGDVFVAPFTDAPEERFAPGMRLLTDLPSADLFEVERSSVAGGKLVVHFVGFDDRPAVETLRGITLRVAVAARPPLEDPDEFYDTELVGLNARTLAGAELGPVTDVLHVGGTTQLVVRVDGRERLIPFVSAIVPSVDVQAGLLLVDPPEGLFDL